MGLYCSSSSSNVFACKPDTTTCESNPKSSEIIKAQKKYDQFFREMKMVGTGVLSDFSSYQLNEYDLLIPLDSVEKGEGTPVCISSHGTEEGYRSRDLYYEGIRYHAGITSPGGNFKLLTIATIRKDIVTPNGIRCGMRLDALRKIVSNLKLTGLDSGYLTVSSPDGGPMFKILVINGSVQMLVLTASAG